MKKIFSRILAVGLLSAGIIAFTDIFGCLLMIRLCSVLLMKPPVSFLIRMSVIW